MTSHRLMSCLARATERIGLTAAQGPARIRAHSGRSGALAPRTTPHPLRAASRRLLWIAALGAVIAGCRRTTRVESGTRDQVLHFGNGEEPRDLDPASLQAAVEYVIDSALYEGLVNVANDGQTILPGVAESWDVSQDGRVYTFHLRRDASWSDGSRLTADDFVYSFRRAFTPTMACETASIGFGIQGARDFASGRSSSPDSIGVRAIDPQTLQVRLEQRQPYILVVLGGAPFEPVPRAVVERFGGGTHPGSAWTRPGNLVSNGAFILASWHANQDLVVVRNPHYWDRGRVRLREIHFYPTDDADSEELAYRSGQLHVTHSLPESRIAGYRLHAESQLHISPELQTAYLLFNTARPPFNDARVRRALSLAIDRDRIVPLVRHETATPAHSLTRPGTGGYSPPSVADYNSAQARALLAEAGYPGGAGFPPADLKLSGRRAQVFGEALQQAWQKVLGVRIAIAQEEQKAMFSDGGAGNFQIIEMSYFYGVNAPESILAIQKGDSPQNYTRWNAPEYERAYARACAAASEAERRAAFDAMEEILSVQAPIIPLFFINQPFLVSTQVKGWRDNTIGQIDWRELWLAP